MSLVLCRIVYVYLSSDSHIEVSTKRFITLWSNIVLLDSVYKSWEIAAANVDRKANGRIIRIYRKHASITRRLFYFLLVIFSTYAKATSLAHWPQVMAGAHALLCSSTNTCSLLLCTICPLCSLS